MRKYSSKGIGKYVYMEWLFPVKDYYSSLRANERIFEIIIPVIIAILGTIVYSSKEKIHYAIEGLSNLLPTVISILIGFTVMLITLLLTGSGENVEKLKSTPLNKRLYNKQIMLYQGLLIQFSYSLLSEICLLLLILLYLFINGLNMCNSIGSIILFLEIFLTLNILLSILRGIVNIYFSYYNTNT